jgi:hypothetical protein
LELHRCPAFGAGRARWCARFGRDRIATVVHRLHYQP